MTYKLGHVIVDPVGGCSYRLGRLLGEGGFGTAYEALQYWTDLPEDERLHDDVCLKIADDRDSWLYESYMGILVRGERRAVQQLETFAFAHGRGRQRTVINAIATEIMEEGTLAENYGERRFADEKWIRRELKALLTLLAKLHESSATHGDIHSGNVYLRRNRLVLGDFGLAGHHLPGRRAYPRGMFGPAIPDSLYDGRRAYWRPSDDLYELGLLFAEAIADEALIRTGACTPNEMRGVVRREGLPQDLKDFLLKLTAPRTSQRFGDAGEALDQLDPEPSVWAALPRSLRGLPVVFTGQLGDVDRAQARMWVLQAGGTVQSKVNGQTRVLVVGDPSRYYRVSTRMGRKLDAASHAASLGQSIALIGIDDLKRLTRPPRRRRVPQ